MVEDSSAAHLSHLGAPPLEGSSARGTVGPLTDERNISVLHLAPHPDDELLGAPATLLGLRDAGHRVVNLACSLGRPADRERRGRELGEALARMRIGGIAVDPPAEISADDDLEAAQRRLSGVVRDLVTETGFDLVIAPTPHDGHHGHEVVGRAAVEAVGGLAEPPRLWMWSFWADLPMPTLFVPFGEDRLAEILSALAAHEGELARNDYAAAVEGRSKANRVLGAERTFGFGESRKDGPYAELLTEVVRAEGDWYAGPPRIPDLGEPLASVRSELPIGWWLEEPSILERRRRAAS